jgi:hypothetical protein
VPERHGSGKLMYTQGREDDQCGRKCKNISRRPLSSGEKILESSIRVKLTSLHKDGEIVQVTSLPHNIRSLSDVMFSSQSRISAFKFFVQRLESAVKTCSEVQEEFHL